MSWYILVLAGVFEIGWALGLQYSDGLSKPLPTIDTVVALVISMILLVQAVEDLPVGTAYAVWTGIGAVGTASLGMLLFDEPATPARITFIGVIVVGIVGLHFASGGHGPTIPDPQVPRTDRYRRARRTKRGHRAPPH